MQKIKFPIEYRSKLAEHKFLNISEILKKFVYWIILEYHFNPELLKSGNPESGIFN